MTRRKNFRLFKEVDLGRFEFAGKRIDISEEDQAEMNTTEETLLYFALLQWINNEKQPTDDNVTLLRAAMTHAKYSGFLCRRSQVHASIVDSLSENPR